MISLMFQDYICHLNDQFSVLFPVNPDIPRHHHVVQHGEPRVFTPMKVPGKSHRSRATELEHRARAVGTLGGHDDVTGVLDGNDDASLEPLGSPQEVLDYPAWFLQKAKWKITIFNKSTMNGLS